MGKQVRRISSRTFAPLARSAVLPVAPAFRRRGEAEDIMDQEYVCESESNMPKRVSHLCTVRVTRVSRRIKERERITPNIMGIWQSTVPELPRTHVERLHKTYGCAFHPPPPPPPSNSSPLSQFVPCTLTPPKRLHLHLSSPPSHNSLVSLSLFTSPQLQPLEPSSRFIARGSSHALAPDRCPLESPL